MKPKPNLQVRNIGSQYMIVEANNGNVNMTKVYELNETAAKMWTWINEGVCDEEKLAGRLCDEYEVDCDTALKDVVKQLEDWKKLGLME